MRFYEISPVTLENKCTEASHQCLSCTGFMYVIKVLALCVYNPSTLVKPVIDTCFRWMDTGYLWDPGFAASKFCQPTLTGDVGRLVLPVPLFQLNCSFFLLPTVCFRLFQLKRRWYYSQGLLRYLPWNSTSGGTPWYNYFLILFWKARFCTEKGKCNILVELSGYRCLTQSSSWRTWRLGICIESLPVLPALVLDILVTGAWMLTSTSPVAK